MSRKLKFYLRHNNQSIRTIDGLREYCSIEQLLIDYREGKLRRWLIALRCFDDIIVEIDCVSVENDLEIAQELVRILEIKQQAFEDYQAKLERVNNRHIPAKDIQDFSSISNFSLFSNFFERQVLHVTIIVGLHNSGTKSLINEMIESRKDLKIVCLPCNHEELEKLNISPCPICGKLAYENGKGKHLDNGIEILEDLIDEVYKILEKTEKIDHLIVEAVGLADPLPIALTFLGTELRDMTHLDSIITMINSADFNLDLDLFNTESAQVQIFYGDVIILNNTDLLNEAKVDLLEARIRDMKESARILRSQKAQVPLPLISSLGWRNIHNISHANQYLDSISLFSFESNQAFSIRKFQYFLDNRLESNVFQGVGILWFKESPKKHQFRLSGKRFSLYNDEWNEEQQNNSLIFIGQNLNSEELNSQLLACLSSNERPRGRGFGR
jgi:G3E family GTPase